MTQNIYDNPEFFAGYSQLGRSVDGLDGAAEWPAMRAMLPAMEGIKVVDLGTANAWFCRWAREHGAAHVLGLDVCEIVLAGARSATPEPAIEYAIADLERFDLPAASIGHAYSSLAMHYVEALDRLLDTVHGALVASGSLVFSVEHPIYTAPSNPGWETDAAGGKRWPIDGYLLEGPRSTDWLTKGVDQANSRCIGHYLNALLRHGFAILHVEEWGPTDAQITARPVLADERQRPPFLLVSAQRTD